MKYPIAVAFSDIHIHIWRQYNTDKRRTKDHLEVLRIVDKKAHELGVPVLFGGDWFHSPDNVKNKLLSMLSGFIMKHGIFQWASWWGITGNHDVPEDTSVTKDFSSYVAYMGSIYKNFNCIDHKSAEVIDPHGKMWAIHGVPYILGNAGFKGAVKNLKKKVGIPNILLIHSDFPGSTDPSGFELKEQNVITEKNLKSVFQGFDLVLVGHVHKPGYLYKSDKLKIISIGAPLQQRTSDSGTDMGYWVIYSDLTLTFIKLKLPQFKYYDNGEEPGNDKDIWIEIPKQTSYESSSKVYTKGLSMGKLVDNYFIATKTHSKKKKAYLTKLLEEGDNV